MVIAPEYTIFVIQEQNAAVTARCLTQLAILYALHLNHVDVPHALRKSRPGVKLSVVPFLYCLFCSVVASFFSCGFLWEFLYSVLLFALINSKLEAWNRQAVI